MKKPIMLVCLLTLAACDLQKKNEKPEAARQAPSEEELIKRGKYLVTIGACHDCHSPKVMTPNGPEPDTTRLLSGHPKDEPLAPIPDNKGWIMFSGTLTSFVGPWGISYAANLTPHETGTGNWTFEQFKTAIRKGKYKGLEGTRDLLPPMPWQMYRNFTDDDLEAIFTYLRSLPPIDNLVPTAIPPNEVQYQLTSNNE
ncbi:MAG TPA: c-type cytochrome [Cyclobacteriaceae bacterium]|nr:c-type cytochrome [Cyclobacteriaceae bacterium]